MRTRPRSRTMAPSFNRLALTFLCVLVIGGGLTAAFGPSLERSAWTPLNAPRQPGVGPTGATADAAPAAPARATHEIDLESVADGMEVPRPDEWLPETATSTLEPPRAAFVEHLLPWVLVANEQVLAERAELWKIRQTTNIGELSVDGRLWLGHIARTYYVEPVDFVELSRRVDGVPASILLAVAAWSTGWNAADEPGWQKLIRATVDASSTTPRSRASRDVPDFRSPVEALLLYLHVVNTQPEFVAFRAARERLRHQGLPLRGPSLSASLPSTPPGKLPRGTVIAELINAERLDRFDDAALAPAMLDQTNRGASRWVGTTSSAR